MVDKKGTIDPPRLAVALASFNRKEVTLRCLRGLYAQALGDISVAVHLFDDNSPDGTANEVRVRFPQVHIINGDGNQFWGGGMRAAMQSAMGAPFDFLLWLNDDVSLFENSILTLLEAHEMACLDYGSGPHIVVGAVTDPATGQVTYSGLTRNNSWHPVSLSREIPNSRVLTPCDTMNGNIVLIPVEVVQQIGVIDPSFIHQLGDFDYGYRAVRSGAKIWLASRPVGTCERDRQRKNWANPSLTFMERLNILNTPQGLPPIPWLKFMWRFGGGLGVILLGIGYMRALGRSMLRSLNVYRQ